jgi:hydrogenase maturation protease
VTVAEPAPAEASPTADGRERGRRVLVAGIGNLFFTDDGFGPEAARQLALRRVPEGVRVTDYGIRGMHLSLDLLDGWDRLILLDLVPSRGRPGTVHVVEIDPHAVGTAAPDPHGMAPHAVLATVGSLGGRLPPTVLVGCEPADIGEGLGLTPVIAAAVPAAVDAVLALLTATGPDLEPAAAGVPTSGGH